jgi:hypothetical protein
VSDADVAKALSSAFLVALCGPEHPDHDAPYRCIRAFRDSAEWSDLALFFLEGLDRVGRELEEALNRDPELERGVHRLTDWLDERQKDEDPKELTERIWAVFFPEAVGIRGNEDARVTELRARRTILITQPSAAPISDPVQEVLLTSNALLTVPAEPISTEALPPGDELRDRLVDATREPQLYWYDHPIPVGVTPDKNEILYGLRGLEEAMAFEQSRGTAGNEEALTVLLSVSTTHRGLQGIARSYLEQEISRAGGLKGISLFAFTEADTERLVRDVLEPAAQRYLGHGPVTRSTPDTGVAPLQVAHEEDPGELLEVFGVDGEYGRHYSFLKAIAAFWSVLIDPSKRATFKIDLDQRFPEEELVAHTGRSALEHLCTPLWGASGVDSLGRPVEMGMLAGAVVNVEDIERSLFTPDVPFPDRAPSLDEHVFYSVLPQALSTEAEMMTRYGGVEPDGRNSCIERIHVTGGTNGILVETLRRHRTFTPSFIGRAEDQAYLLSAITGGDLRLACAHADGFIMRHDKHAFAQEAMRAAAVGKTIGDYARILYFSAYARALPVDVEKVKETFDPFTGCFVSRIPVTVTYLRFTMKLAALFEAGDDHTAMQFLRNGCKRIEDAIDFAFGGGDNLREQYLRERRGWNLYYEVLDAIERALGEGDPFALEIRDAAERIVNECAVRS